MKWSPRSGSFFESRDYSSPGRKQAYSAEEHPLFCRQAGHGVFD